MTTRERIANTIHGNEAYTAQQNLQVEIASSDMTGEDIIAKLNQAQVEAIAEIARNYQALGREKTTDEMMQILYPLPDRRMAQLQAQAYIAAGKTLVAMVQRS